MRLNKWMSDRGICSRREADRLIEAGRVKVDGQTAVLGQQIPEEALVEVEGRPVGEQSEKVLLAVHKPRGIVCTTSRQEKDNIIDFLNYPERIYFVGRLDKDSSGLLLMTNQGDIVNKITRARYYHEKEYVVDVDKPITDQFIKSMGSGVPILDTVTRPCRIEQTGPRRFTIILTQGLNRQIRRMCEYLGYQVTSLIRVRVMNIQLGDLKPGEYRLVEGEELRRLNELLEKSSL